MMSTLVTAAQWGIIFAAFAGQTATQMAAGGPLAPVVQSIQENKMPAAGGAWFVGSSLSASFLKTGAFEVLIREPPGEPGEAGGGESITVWSGIKRGGRPPATAQEMQNIIEALRAAGVQQQPRREQPAPAAIEEEPSLPDDL